MSALRVALPNTMMSEKKSSLLASLSHAKSSPVELREAPAEHTEAEHHERRRHDVASLHGESAAQRQAITELLFFASVGDVKRCKRICATWTIDVSLVGWLVGGDVVCWVAVCSPPPDARRRADDDIFFA